MANQASGASRCFVVCRDARVVGYYTLSASALAAAAAPGRIRRNMPDPIPMILLGRLAVDRREQGRGLGSDLLHDAVLRAKAAAEIVGARGLLVQALDEAASGFYVAHGFRPSPADPKLLMVGFQDLAAAIA
jgi:GNAT superfamily N-acetyltransferase